MDYSRFKSCQETSDDGMCASPGHWCRTIGHTVQCKPYRGGVRARLDHINESYEL